MKLENEDGEEVDIGGLTEGGKGVVIFVYPKVCPVYSLFRDLFGSSWYILSIYDSIFYSFDSSLYIPLDPPPTITPTPTLT